VHNAHSPVSRQSLTQIESNELQINKILQEQLQQLSIQKEQRKQYYSDAE